MTCGEDKRTDRLPISSVRYYYQHVEEVIFGKTRRPRTNDHTAEGDLQGPQVRVRLEQVDDARETEHRRHGEQALGDQGRVVDWPVDPVHLPVEGGQGHRGFTGGLQ